jgi:hypothetical protein
MRRGQNLQAFRLHLKSAWKCRTCLLLTSD